MNAAECLERKLLGEPRCPKCGYVMCQRFNYQAGGIAVPNGNYRCYHCNYERTKEMNAAECHYRLRVVMETQERLTLDLAAIVDNMRYGRAQDLMNLQLAGTHMRLALENLAKLLGIDVEQVLHIALAQEVEDKHARASEAKP